MLPKNWPTFIANKTFFANPSVVTGVKSFSKKDDATVTLADFMGTNPGNAKTFGAVRSKWNRGAADYKSKGPWMRDMTPVSFCVCVYSCVDVI